LFYTVSKIFQFLAPKRLYQSLTTASTTITIRR